MLNFSTVNLHTFLTEYWQKKPLLIRQAIPGFINPLTADELAGLALEDDFESRMVFETPEKAPLWQLKTGPFVERDFTTLPATHWTLLVQGVDRLIPEVTCLLDHFDFIPQWRVDDVMVSYAVKHGSVGPHYDNYDVFLYQARGRRKWSLTTQHCTPENALQGVELRIMEQFNVEEEYVLEEGDMLYLPPHVGHHGISLDDDCMTYSFGYRSYQGTEVWDSFGEHLSEQAITPILYRDPNWSDLPATSAILPEAWQQAKQLMQTLLDDEQQLKTWFGCFATRPDANAEQLMPLPLSEDEWGDLPAFIQALTSRQFFVRDATCRLAYQDDGQQLFMNGCVWDVSGVATELVKWVANYRIIQVGTLTPFLSTVDNQLFLYDLWTLQWYTFL